MAHMQIDAAGSAFESLLYTAPHLIIDYQHLPTSRRHNRQSHCSDHTDDSSDDSDLDEALFDSVEDAKHEAYLRTLDPRDWKVTNRYIFNFIYIDLH